MIICSCKSNFKFSIMIILNVVLVTLMFIITVIDIIMFTIVM